MKYLIDTGRKRTWRNRLFGKCWLDPNAQILYPFDTQYGWNPFQENEFTDFKGLWNEMIRKCFEPLTEALREFARAATSATDAFRQFAEFAKACQTPEVSDA